MQAAASARTIIALTLSAVACTSTCCVQRRVIINGGAQLLQAVLGLPMKRAIRDACRTGSAARLQVPGARHWCAARLLRRSYRGDVDGAIAGCLLPPGFDGGTGELGAVLHSLTALGSRGHDGPAVLAVTCLRLCMAPPCRSDSTCCAGPSQGA
jgi:hypothetical protein